MIAAPALLGYAGLLATLGVRVLGRAGWLRFAVLTHGAAVRTAVAEPEGWRGR